MILSNLQKYILRRGLDSRNRRIGKKALLEFYASVKKAPSPADRLSIVTKSVERLISRGLIRGLGIKTAEKWFIAEVILTPSGAKKARELLGRQVPLPFKIKKHK